jgi:hypothetical protein
VKEKKDNDTDSEFELVESKHPEEYQRPDGEDHDEHLKELYKDFLQRELVPKIDGNTQLFLNTMQQHDFDIFYTEKMLLRYYVSKLMTRMCQIQCKCCYGPTR